MTERTRKRFFAVVGPVFFGCFVYASLDMPPWGTYRGPYGDLIANVAVYERHATDVVNAINYDYRGFDTLGEEFILFTAVVGVMMMLRRDPGISTAPAGQQGKVQDKPTLGIAVRAMTIPAVVLTVVFGFYIGLHGALTPGGGFQAGVILASALLLVYLAENTDAFKRITSHTAVDLIEAIGAGAYALIGLAPLVPRPAARHQLASTRHQRRRIRVWQHRPHLRHRWRRGHRRLPARPLHLPAGDRHRRGPRRMRNR